MRIRWFSRHVPLPAQIESLHQLWPNFELTQDPKPFSSALDIKRRAEEAGADELIVVAPLSVMAELVKLGLRPIRAIMTETTSVEEAHTTAGGRMYRFDGWERVLELRLVTEPVVGEEPSSERTDGGGGAHL